MSTLKRIAQAALTAGLFLDAECEGELDYTGLEINKFMKAMNACDEMRAVFYDVNGICKGWLYYSAALDHDEQIIDHDGAGFVNDFFNSGD